jgi:predicted metal-dependent HD superfamily phosphohydrolase
MDLENIWNKTANSLGFDLALSQEYWNEIYSAYSSEGRYYHGLEHLRSIFRLTEEEVLSTTDRQALNLAVFYHDIVYDFERKDNERKSADLAIDRLSRAGVDQILIERVEELIMATYGHEYSDDALRNLMIEADVSVIGTDHDTYAKYAENCRREYSMFSDEEYNPVRKQALSHFLNTGSLFVSPKFKERFEANAKRNLQWEIDQL